MPFNKSEKSTLLPLGRRKCTGSSDTVHLQRIVGVFDILAYFRHYGSSAFCWQIL